MARRGRLTRAYWASGTPQGGERAMVSGTASLPVVVVGASLAGASAVEALRREGYDGRLVLVGTETHPPYDRPQLSKGLLLGTTPDAKVTLRDAAFYAAQGVELRVGTRATGLDAAARTLLLDG